jgi:hypothetical protein
MTALLREVQSRSLRLSPRTDRDCPGANSRSVSSQIPLSLRGGRPAWEWLQRPQTSGPRPSPRRAGRAGRSTALLPWLERVVLQSPPDRRRRLVAIARSITKRCSSVRENRLSGRPWVTGSSHSSALTSGGKRRGRPAPGRPARRPLCRETRSRCLQDRSSVSSTRAPAFARVSTRLRTAVAETPQFVPHQQRRTARSGWSRLPQTAVAAARRVRRLPLIQSSDVLTARDSWRRGTRACSASRAGRGPRARE